MLQGGFNDYIVINLRSGIIFLNFFLLYCNVNYNVKLEGFNCRLAAEQVLFFHIFNRQAKTLKSTKQSWNETHALKEGMKNRCLPPPALCLFCSFLYLPKKKTPKIMPVLRTNIATNDNLVPHLTCTVADSDLQIRGGDGHPDPEIRRTWS